MIIEKICLYAIIESEKEGDQMTREQRLKLFAFDLYNKGFRSTDIKQIRKDNILTPYETEVIMEELIKTEKRFNCEGNS